MRSIEAQLLKKKIEKLCNIETKLKLNSVFVWEISDFWASQFFLWFTYLTLAALLQMKYRINVISNIKST